MRRRNFLKAATAATCAASTPIQFARAELKKATAVTIKFVPNWGLGGFAKKLADRFMRENPGIRIEFSDAGSFSKDDYDRALLKAYKEGDPYDMVITGPYYSRWATQSGYTIDPAPLFERDFGVDYQNKFKNILSFWDGTMIGVPFQSGTELFYYNQDMIEQLGFSLPVENWNWADMLEISKAAMRYDASGQLVQWGCSVFEADLFRLYVAQMDQRLFTPDYRQATVDTTAAHEAMQFVHDLIFKHKVVGGHAQWRTAQLDRAYSWNHEAFYGGKVAMLRDGDIRLAPAYNSAKAGGFRVGVAPPLQHEKKAVGTGATIFQIWKSPDPKRTAAAWEFAKYWLTPENQAALLNETGHSPATHAAYEHPIGQQCLEKWPDLAVFRDAYQYADPTAGINDFPTMALEYLGMRPFVYQLVMGKLSPQETIKQMQGKCEEILDIFWTKADKGIFELFPEELHK